MKKIIVPIDFSDESIKGLKLAIIYANKFRADLQMVYVQKPVTGKFKIKIENEYNAVLEAFMDLVDEYRGELFDGCDFSYIIKKGKVYEEVARQAEAFDDSMIICSTNGESGFARFVMGSNSYHIIQETTRPVITLTTDKYLGDVKRIVMPLDITKETREKLPVVIQIAKAFGSEVHIVRVTSSSNEGIHNKLKMYATQVHNILEQEGIKHQSTLLVGDNITEITIEYAQTIDADLIAIMTEQTNSISNWLLGSYAHQMLNMSPIPVLSVTPKGLFFVYGAKTSGER